ncbi:SH3 domain-containing protein [Streptomyces sp. NPDC006012]|uniref:SH3 domain-containing protein n=1 Tax=Streptomyces sp. NPDC006012 TaxID=3364739 RepID=UPI0036AE10BB
MIRRTVKNGLLATVAALALLPAAASAAEAGQTAPLPAPTAAAPQYALPAPLPAPTRHTPAKHRATHRRGPAAHRHKITRRTTVTGRVITHHVRLNVRSGPGTGYRVVGHRHGNRLVRLICRTHGSRVFGTRTWYRLAHHKGFVSARYVRVRGAVPWC